MIKSIQIELRIAKKKLRVGYLTIVVEKSFAAGVSHGAWLVIWLGIS